jgi:hypothetical protein
MEVVREGTEIMRVANEEAMQTPPGASAEERLERYIHAYLPRIVHADQSGWIFRLMRHERAHPTAASALIVERAIMPRLEHLSKIVSDLLGSAATPSRVRQCAVSIQAQCFFYAPDPFKLAMFDDWPRTDAEIRETARHITAFSLAGIRAIAAGAKGKP